MPSWGVVLYLEAGDIGNAPGSQGPFVEPGTALNAEGLEWPAREVAVSLADFGGVLETAGPRRRRCRRKASRPGQKRAPTIRRISWCSSSSWLLRSSHPISSVSRRWKSVESNTRTQAAILRQRPCRGDLPVGPVARGSPNGCRITGVRSVISLAGLPGRVLLEWTNDILCSGFREIGEPGSKWTPRILGRLRSSNAARLKLVTLEATQGRIDPTPIRLLKAKQWLEPNLPAPPAAYVDGIRSLSSRVVCWERRS